jgi:hypothetical protein
VRQSCFATDIGINDTKQYVISIICKRTLSTVRLYIKLPSVLAFKRQLSNSGLLTAVVAEGFHIWLHCLSRYREVDHGRLLSHPYLHTLIHERFPPNIAVSVFAFGRSLVYISGRRPAVPSETCHGFSVSSREYRHST